MNTIAPTISAPMIADGLCRIRRNASRQSPTGLSSATPSKVVAMALTSSGSSGSGRRS